MTKASMCNKKIINRFLLKWKKNFKKKTSTWGRRSCRCSAWGLRHGGGELGPLGPQWQQLGTASSSGRGPGDPSLASGSHELQGGEPAPILHHPFGVQEVMTLTADPPDGIKVFSNEEDLTDLQVTIENPKRTPALEAYSI